MAIDTIKDEITNITLSSVIEKAGKMANASIYFECIGGAVFACHPLIA